VVQVGAEVGLGIIEGLQTGTNWRLALKTVRVHTPLAVPCCTTGTAVGAG
jgi:hypothetical protein